MLFNTIDSLLRGDSTAGEVTTSVNRGASVVVTPRRGKALPTGVLVKALAVARRVTRRVTIAVFMLYYIICSLVVFATVLDELVTKRFFENDR
jgi:hypothetical protein